MIQHIVPIDATQSSAEVNNLFKHNPSLQSLPVVQQDKQIGIISRNKIGELFSDRYSYPLYGNKTITKFMDVKPIIVEHEERLYSVSEKITGDVSNNLNIDFIITKDKRYCGVGKVSTLLKILTDAQIQRARHSNPLTLLPVNILIYNHVEALICQQQDFHLAYFDINHFKPSNDYFGYNTGDDATKLLSAILLEHSAPVFDMVGYIGGDDFKILFKRRGFATRCLV
jgi:CBS domain-containing protein